MDAAASPNMVDVKLPTCLEWVASAMAYLQSRRILQCSYIYINSGHSCPEVFVLDAHSVLFQIIP